MLNVEGKSASPGMPNQPGIVSLLGERGFFAFNKAPDCAEASSAGARLRAGRASSGRAMRRSKAAGPNRNAKHRGTEIPRSQRGPQILHDGPEPYFQTLTLGGAWVTYAA